MKSITVVLAAAMFFSVACSSLKNRREAAEESRQKAMTESENAPAGPIDEDIPDTGGPVKDQVLDEELAKMGINPNNPDGIKHEQDSARDAVATSTPSKPAPLQGKKTAKKTDTKKKKKPEKKTN